MLSGSGTMVIGVRMYGLKREGVNCLKGVFANFLS